MNSKTQETVKTLSPGKTFTTAPKLRRVTWHKLGTVRTRACALQESFYPTAEVPYAAVKTRMVTLLGIVDRTSILAYLGRPEHRTRQVMDQTVEYPQAQVQKKHTFYRKLKGKNGYIEVFGLGYIFIMNGEWFVHWNHTEQLTLPRVSSNELPLEGEPSNSPTEIDERVRYNITPTNCSKEHFSLTPKGSTPKDECELCSGVSERKRRERYSIRERNCETESNRQNSMIQHCEKVKVFTKKFCRKSVKNKPSQHDSKGRWLSAKESRILQSASKEVDSPG